MVEGLLSTGLPRLVFNGRQDDDEDNSDDDVDNDANGDNDDSDDNDDKTDNEGNDDTNHDHVSPSREDPLPQPKGTSDREDLDPEEEQPATTDSVSVPCSCGNCPHMEMHRENICCRSELRWQNEFDTEGHIASTVLPVPIPVQLIPELAQH